MGTNDIENELDKITVWEEKIKKNNLKYETKNAY